MISCVSMEGVSIIKVWGEQWSISSLHLYILCSWNPLSWSAHRYG